MRTEKNTFVDSGDDLVTFLWSVNRIKIRMRIKFPIAFLTFGKIKIREIYRYRDY